MGVPPPTQILYKSHKGYTLVGQIHTKNYQFWQFWGAVSPHFKSDNGKIWRKGTDLRHPPPPLIL